MNWKIFKYAAAAIAVAVLVLLLWGTLFEPRFVDFKNETAQIENLPEQWNGKQIALISGSTNRYVVRQRRYG